MSRYTVLRITRSLASGRNPGSQTPGRCGEDVALEDVGNVLSRDFDPGDPPHTFGIDGYSRLLHLLIQWFDGALDLLAGRRPHLHRARH